MSREADSHFKESYLFYYAAVILRNVSPWFSSPTPPPSSSIGVSRRILCVVRVNCQVALTILFILFSTCKEIITQSNLHAVTCLFDTIGSGGNSQQEAALYLRNES